jgi:hypothetical protein
MIMTVVIVIVVVVNIVIRKFKRNERFHVRSSCWSSNIQTNCVPISGHPNLKRLEWHNAVEAHQ